MILLFFWTDSKWYVFAQIRLFCLGIHSVWANSVCPDQTVPEGAVSSRSAVFCCFVFRMHYSIVKQLCSNFRIITATFKNCFDFLGNLSNGILGNLLLFIYTIGIKLSIIWNFVTNVFTHYAQMIYLLNAWFAINLTFFTWTGSSCSWRQFQLLPLILE